MTLPQGESKGNYLLCVKWEGQKEYCILFREGLGVKSLEPQKLDVVAYDCNLPIPSP